jgi:ubiquitin C-terminal hydrolase
VASSAEAAVDLSPDWVFGTMLFPACTTTRPLCNSSQSRAAAFDLLAALESRQSTKSATYLRAVFDLFVTLHENDTSLPQRMDQPSAMSPASSVDQAKARAVAFIEPESITRRRHFDRLSGLGLSYAAAEHTRAAGGFVGLKNQGLTCYINSVLQQCFMVPRFRAGVLASLLPVVEHANFPATVLHPQRLVELLQCTQEVFGALDQSNESVHDPVKLVTALRNEPMGFFPLDSAVFEQNDASEFYQLFVDRLDTIVQDYRAPLAQAAPDGANPLGASSYDLRTAASAGAAADVAMPPPAEVGASAAGLSQGGAPVAPLPSRTFVQDSFGGSVVSQLICKDCPHRSDKTDQFLGVSLDIKNKMKLSQSLELYVQEEIMEGENAYHCEACGFKVTAMKRMCFKDLPNTLVLHLKRFELDYDTMEKSKLNDEFQFPFELDMYPYTADGLEDAGGAGSDLAPGRNAKAKTKYELGGVLVHAGTANSGHYYSFVKDRRFAAGSSRHAPQPSQWWELNDDRVAALTEAQLADQCYGGWGPSVGGASTFAPAVKEQNAFMLFYDLIQGDTTPAVGDLSSAVGASLSAAKDAALGAASSDLSMPGAIMGAVFPTAVYADGQDDLAHADAAGSSATGALEKRRRLESVCAGGVSHAPAVCALPPPAQPVKCLQDSIDRANAGFVRIQHVFDPAFGAFL